MNCIVVGCNISIIYYSGEINMVANALSWKVASMDSWAFIIIFA